MPETYQQKQERYRRYKRLEVAKKQLDMDDETFRALLLRVSDNSRDITIDGIPSRKMMTLHDLFKADEEMRRLGFKVKRPHAPGSVANISGWRRPLVLKICALWFALHDAGVVKNRAEAAMIKWCAAVSKQKHLQWMTKQQLNQCIEGLKSWAKREKVTLRD